MRTRWKVRHKPPRERERPARWPAPSSPPSAHAGEVRACSVAIVFAEEPKKMSPSEPLDHRCQSEADVSADLTTIERLSARVMTPRSPLQLGPGGGAHTERISG